MISHRYEDYANRLGIHILDALTAVLLWPAVVVVALWAWRGVPTVWGNTSGLDGDMVTMAVIDVIVIVAMRWFSKKLSWFNIPFELDDPRRAMAYPVALYGTRFFMLYFTLAALAIIAPSYAPQLNRHTSLIHLSNSGLLLIAIAAYAYRIVTLWKRKEL